MMHLLSAVTLAAYGFTFVLAQQSKLLTVTDQQISMRMSTDLGKAIHDYLDQNAICTIFRMGKRQDRVTDCLRDTARVLSGNTFLMMNLIAIYRGSPNPGEYGDISSLPGFANDPVNDALVAGLPDVANAVFNNIPGATIIEVPVMILAASVIASERIWNHPNTFENFAVGRKGQMRKSCPAQEEIPCSSQLCQSQDGTTCSAFLRPCPCNNLMCKPAGMSNRQVLECVSDCGGKDPVTSRCKGRVEDNYAQKGCTCVTLEPPHAHIWPNTDDWQQMLTDARTFNDFLSNPQQPDSTKCTKSNIEHIESRPDTWKPSGYRQEASYQQPPADQTDVHTRDLNYVKLRIEWDTTNTFSKEDCESKFKALSADCDWSPNPVETNPNIFNWKWGGVYTDTGGIATYTIEPQTPRARTAQYLFPDQSHGWDIRTANPADDINKPRHGMNGQQYDLVVMHQCIHGWRNVPKPPSDPLVDLNPPPWSVDVTCMGLVNFGVGHTDGYQSWDDCWLNTWEWLSWQLLDQGFISGYMEHYGNSVQKCWAGIDPFDAPSKRGVEYRA